MQRRRHFFEREFYIWVCLMSVIMTGGCGKEQDADEIFSVEDGEAEAAVTTEGLTEDASELAEENTCIYVFVCGEIVSPGVYEMEMGDRVVKAIEKAGGLSENAALTAVNQAELLLDGQKIYIPSREEYEKGILIENSEGDTTVGKKMNINTAGKAELMTLSGIGEARADAILQFREKHGNFRTIEQLKEVEGIKEGIYNKIKEEISVN